MNPPFCYFLLFLIFLLFACQRNKDHSTVFEYKQPAIIAASGYRIPVDKISPPVIVRAGKITKRLAGKPEIVSLKSNIFSAKVSSITPAGSPVIIFPKTKKYENPRVVHAVVTPYLAGAPEVTSLEVPYVRKVNTGSFSSIRGIHGLKTNEISSVLQDKNGNLWFGSWWGGVTRFDGHSLYNYTMTQGLKSDVVNCMFEDSSGDIWVGTYDNGVNRFDGKYFTHYSTTEGLPGNNVNNILQDSKGNMWFATNNGLARFDGRAFTQFGTLQGLPTNNTRSLMEDNKGHLWIGSYGGVTKFDGTLFQNYTSCLNLKDDTDVFDLLQDTDGNVWFGTNIGLFKHDGNNIEHYTTKGGLNSNTITSLTKENNGNIWIGTRGGGASIYDGKTFTHFGPEQGLANEIVTSIIQDKWGHIWLGTTAGVCKYEGKMFSHTTPVNQQEIEALLADHNGNVWMGSGTDSCLNKYDGNNMARFTNKEGLTSTRINQLYEDKRGNIWIATWDGVEKYDGKYFTHYSTVNGLVDNVVFCTLEDKNGVLWFGTDKGLSRFDGRFFTNYSKAHGLCSESITSTLEDHSGNLWIGTSNNGICRFDGNSFLHYGLDSSVSHPMILGMVEDRDNNIWFSTGFGANKFDGKYFTWYTTEQGLSNNNTKNILEDREGNIWIGTINGLNRYTPPLTTSPNNPLSSSYFKTYTMEDGFSGAGTYENALSMNPEGTIWIGANDILTRYHPSGEFRDTIAPVLNLTGIFLFGERINWTDIDKYKDSTFTLQNGAKLQNVHFNGLSKWYNQPEDLQLRYNNNYITFQFIGTTTNRPKEVSYLYTLEGLDNTWSSTAEPSATYNNLPHGSFILKVKSVNGEGYWSDELQYHFVIHPPWWETTVAWWIYAIAIAGMIWIFIRYRSKKLMAENILLEAKVSKRTDELKRSLEERYKLSEQIKSQQALLNERLRISRELHDDIGSTLGSISIYSEVAKKRTDKNENPGTILSKIGNASRELIEKMSDIVWSLNLNNENFDQMQHRMRSFASMILAPHNIQYHFDVDEETKHIQLTNVQAKNIFLIYKEALHNMVKYADCSKAYINIHSQGNELTMMIRDNGKGFRPLSIRKDHTGKYPGGNGIGNMYVRCGEMHGTLTFNSAINGGTAIKLTVPL